MRLGSSSARGVALAAALVLAPLRAAAEADEGRLSFRPVLGVTYEANDNGNLARNGDGRDWVHGVRVEPSVALELRRPRWRTGADLGADLRYSFNESRLRDEFLDLTAYAEGEPLRGLHFRVSNSFVPQPISLGAPADDVTNLRQSNLVRAEARYRHERERGLALELGIRGSRFDAEGFPAQIDSNGDGVVENVGGLHLDYWQASAFLETQRSLGRRSLVYLRGEMRDRRFDELPHADLTEWSGLAGVRSQLARRLDLDLALGYGRVKYDDLGSDSRLLGRADVDYAMPRGWGLRGTFVQRFSSDVAGADFDESTAVLGLSKLLGARNRADLRLLWTHFRSGSPDADDNVVTAVDFSLTRQLARAIEGVLAYRHWRNTGDDKNDDFHQNRVTLGITYRR